MPAKAKIEVSFERIGIKLPIGLYREMETIIASGQRWRSRQDFIIDAVREKLDRVQLPTAPDGQRSKR
ncbi:MAG: ribbon-helix-helix domain-containing protein [Nitrososphaerales archaeon]